MLLHIALQEGFKRNTVVLRVNGKTIYHRSNVKTRTQIGFAASIEQEIEAGPIRLEVLLPQEGISGFIELLVESGTYVGVSIIKGEVSFKVQIEPFGYL